MTRPAKPKPQAFEEVARVLSVFDMLAEELGRRSSSKTMLEPLIGSVLAVAERIAARTEG